MRFRRASRLEDFEKFLFFVHRNLEIRGDRVGKLAGVFDPHSGDHRVVIQALRELDVLLEKAGDAAGGLLDLRRGLSLHWDQADRGAEEAFVARDAYDFGALGSLDQDFNVAVRQLHALHDIRERSNLSGFPRASDRPPRRRAA